MLKYPEFNVNEETINKLVQGLNDISENKKSHVFHPILCDLFHPYSVNCLTKLG